MAKSIKRGSMSPKRHGAIKGPLTSVPAATMAPIQKLFSAQSRRTFRAIEIPTLEERLFSNERQDDTSAANRVAFAIVFKLLDFTASLMNPSDKLFFTRKLDSRQRAEQELTMQDLYKVMEVYHRHIRQQFPPESQGSMENYMNDMAAGLYDLTDAFLSVRAEYRPQLLHLVTKFRAGQVNLEHHGQIPETLVEQTDDQQSPLRLYGQYFEAGYRVAQLNNTQKEHGTYSGYKELELLRRGNAMTGADLLAVVDYASPEAFDLETLGRQCQEALNKIAAGSNVASVGVVKTEFALNPGQLQPEPEPEPEPEPVLAHTNADTLVSTCNAAVIIRNARALSKEKHGESIEITKKLAQALLDDTSGEEFSVLTIGGKEGEEGQREIYVGQGRPYTDEETAKELFKPNQLASAMAGWTNIKPVSFLRVVGGGGYYLSFTGDE